MQRLIFEYSPAYLLVCLLAGLLYAFILYRARHHWTPVVNNSLFAVRTVAVTVLTFLLLGPVLKLTTRYEEKPTLLMLVDDSESVRETTDSLQRNAINAFVSRVNEQAQQRRYAAHVRYLSGTSESDFYHQSSDLTTSMRSMLAEFEGKNPAAVVLLSDGIYNAGTSPLFVPWREPIYTVGIGDTTQRKDIAIANVGYNKIAYQGNRFPVRVEVVVKQLRDQPVQVALVKKGKTIASQTQNSGNKTILYFDFEAEAEEKGMQRFDVRVTPIAQEVNIKNNNTAIFLEVVEGKKKIVLIAPGPHPDIKAIRAVVEKNANYEFILHIPAVKEADQSTLQPAKTDLVVFHQPFDNTGSVQNLYNRYKNSNTAWLLMLGSKTNFRQLSANGLGISFEVQGQTDEVFPVVNNQFKNFNFDDNTSTAFSKYPPVNVPFGKFSFPATADVLLWQRIGTVTTNRPLLLTWDDNNRKTAVLIGEGIWRWRLDEYEARQETSSFDEVFGKLLQFLSTKEDKRKFRSFPLKNEFTDAESVVFESQVFNDLFEPVYGNKVTIEIRNENNEAQVFEYEISSGNQRYRLGALPEGVYRYRASTLLNNKQEAVTGEFLVTEQNLEAQNLTADFGLLKKLSAETDGKFYTLPAATQLVDDITGTDKFKSIIRSEDSFNAVINLKIFFFVILGLLTLEWFTRKFLGAY